MSLSWTISKDGGEISSGSWEEGAQFYMTSLNVLHVDEKEPSGVCSWSRTHLLAHPISLKSAPLFVPLGVLVGISSKMETKSP